MATCPAVSTGDAFLSTVLRHIDCQGQTIGSVGYQALSDPGSAFSLALTGLLTIFVAIFGLRLMLAGALTLRDGVLAMVKIGVVLVIATSWPAYRVLAYDVIVHGPAEVGAAIGRPTGLPGAHGELIGRLQIADAAIIRLTSLGSGRNDPANAFQAPANGPAGPPQHVPIPDDPAFGSARVLFLSGTIAAFVVVRLMSGLLLALAPLFAGLLLFDIARGLFVGWLRALVFTFLASIATTFILGIELVLLEPWLAHVLALRQAQEMTASAPVELLILCLAFALALAGSFALILRLAFMIHIPTAPSLAPLLSRISVVQEPVVAPSPRAELIQPPSRAQVVARALTAAQTRELASQPGAAPTFRRSVVQAAAPADEFAIPSSAQALRRTRSRTSSGATLRDRRS
jgi:type IV secretion system protein VirB6